MKKIVISFMVFMITILNLNAGNVNEARAKAYVLSRLMQRSGYTIGAVKGEYLSNGSSITYSRYLYSGNNYVVIGAGDRTVRDLDVMVYDSNWNEIAADNDVSNATAVKFYATSSGTYHFVTKMYSGYGHFFQLLGWR